MSDGGPLLNFFAGVSTYEGEIVPQRIRVDGTLQRELSDLFEQQAAVFLKEDDDRVEYVPKTNYRLERGEVYILRNIALPAAFQEATLKPHQAQDLFLGSTFIRKTVPSITTIFASDGGEHAASRVLFQQFRSPQLLDRKFALQWNGSVFNQLSNNGLTLAHGIVAIWQGGNLYFRSFYMVSRFFDLAAYQPEATKEEISQFLDSNLFAYESDESQASVFRLIEGDGFLRRRVASIQSNDVLSVVTPMKARTKATRFGISISVKRLNGKAKISLPTVKRDLKAVVKFLNEEFFHGELTGRQYSTNSLKSHNSQVS